CVWPAEPQPVGGGPGLAAAAVATGAVGGVLATGAAVGGGAERGVVISGHRSPQRDDGVWCMVLLRCAGGLRRCRCRPAPAICRGFFRRRYRSALSTLDPLAALADTLIDRLPAAEHAVHA